MALTDAQKFDTVMLEMLQLMASQVISRPEMIRARYEAHLVAPMTMDALVATLVAYIPAQKQSIEYPADWWEALKQRWAPWWFVRRWPVRMVHFDAWRLWQSGPEMPYNWGQEMRFVVEAPQWPEDNDE